MADLELTDGRVLLVKLPGTSRISTPVGCVLIHPNIVFPFGTSPSSLYVAAEIPVRTKTPKKNHLLTTPPSGWDPEITPSFLERLRPKIKEFLTNPHFPMWMPPETVDTNIHQFYHNLAIPKMNDKPNLLLHNISSGTNPNVDTLFQNGAHHR